MLIPLLLVLAQDPQQAAPPAIASVQVTPASAEVQVGQTIQMEGRALGSDGQPVTGARIRWFAAGNGGTIDSTGVLTGGFLGTTQVTAVASVPRVEDRARQGHDSHRPGARRRRGIRGWPHAYRGGDPAHPDRGGVQRPGGSPFRRHGLHLEQPEGGRGHS